MWHYSPGHKSLRSSIQTQFLITFLSLQYTEITVGLSKDLIIHFRIIFSSSPWQPGISSAAVNLYAACPQATNRTSESLMLSVDMLQKHIVVTRFPPPTLYLYLLQSNYTTTPVVCVVVSTVKCWILRCYFRFNSMWLIVYIFLYVQCIFTLYMYIHTTNGMYSNKYIIATSCSVDSYYTF